ncbi:MAG: FkbM family methyltransferase [Verrucomicrobiales bacterium]|nr:FkbM family methyltransferase [Verrucomicrobiales bacterium]
MFQTTESLFREMGARARAPYLPGITYTSHIGQDAWVATCLAGKRAGFFLDIGAFDGLTISNTYALERDLGWKGICVEPNPRYYARLCACRECVAVNVALWTESNRRLSFVDAHGLSAIEAYKDGDSNRERRSNSTMPVIEVDTLTPNDLLARFKAPAVIDYLTLDVEGAEMDVLSVLDLNRWRFGLMTIEHNHDRERQERIRAHLAGYGYEVVDNRNDDFFFHRDHLKMLLEDPGPDPVEVCRRVFESFPVAEDGPSTAAKAAPPVQAPRGAHTRSQKTEILQRDAEALFQAGAWDSAAPIFKVLNARHPDELAYWRRHVECLEKQGFAVVADLLREEAVRAHPEWEPLLVTG